MTINLVHGHSAGGMLRRARTQLGLAGDVRVIDDDLSVGPLLDDETRDNWWEIVWGNHPAAHRPGLYAQWKAIGEELQLSPARELVVWSSDSARDHVLERMAAFVLSSCANPVFQVRAPASRDLEGVSFHSVEALAEMSKMRRAIAPGEWVAWAASFEQSLRQSAGVRQLRQGAITILPESALDESLLANCSIEWAKWYLVIGYTMSDCDGQNLIADAFLSWRLRLLVEAGLLEAQGDLTSEQGLEGVLVRRTA